MDIGYTLGNQWLHTCYAGLGAAMSAIALITLALELDVRFLQRHIRRHTLMRRLMLGAFSLLLALNLASLLSKGDSPLVVMVQGLTILLPTVLLFAALHLRSRVAGPPPGRRTVLVVGAHPDDIELGCGATVARMSDHKHRVHAITMSHGAHGGDSRERVGEASKGADFLGVEKLHLFDFPDTRLAEHAADMVAVIEQVIDEVNPDVILTHSSHDQHQNHTAVHLATMRAARRHHSIVCYESPSVTRSFDPSIFVDVDDYIDVKVAAVNMHQDQADKPYMTANRLRGVAAFRGQQARLRNAEAFEPVRVLHSGFVALD